MHSIVTRQSRPLREAEVLAAGRHGRVESLLERFVVIVLGQV